MRERLTPILTHLSKPAVALGSAAAIAVIAIIIAWQTISVAPSGHYTTAILSPITALGGANSDLSFQVPGQISSIPVSIGQTVSVGTALVALDQAALLASRAGAAANLEAAQAKLAALLAGTRPEQLAIDETAVAQAQNALVSALSAAYTNADDAIHAKADQVFSNPQTASALLAILVPDTTLVNQIQMERIALEPQLSSWSTTLASSQNDAESLVAPAEANLKNIVSFLDALATALAKTAATGSIPATTLIGYQTSVNAGRLNVLAALSNLISADTAYKASTGALALARAGTTANDIAAQKATVNAASAALRGIDVTLAESVLRAPFSGTITTLNAHLGQTVIPGQTLVSIESSGGSKESALVVPTSSVIDSDGQTFVFVKSSNNAPVKTTVITGLVGTNGMTEIVSGLREGDKVLSFGTFGT